jgi:hypothetical protein
VRRRRSRFFEKKRRKKLLLTSILGIYGANAPGQRLKKFFASFFKRRSAFCFFILPEIFRL